VQVKRTGGGRNYFQKINFKTFGKIKRAAIFAPLFEKNKQRFPNGKPPEDKGI